MNPALSMAHSSPPSRISLHQVAAQGRGAPVPLDMPHDQLGALLMGHVGRALWVIHRVGEIPHEDAPHPPGGHLLDPEGPVQDAHVCVHSHDQQDSHATGAHEAVYLAPAIRDHVAVRDLDGGVLPRPRLLAGLLPRVAATVRIVYGKARGRGGHNDFPGLREGGPGDVPPGDVPGVESHGVGG